MNLTLLNEVCEVSESLIDQLHRHLEGKEETSTTSASVTVGYNPIIIVTTVIIPMILR